PNPTSRRCNLKYSLTTNPKSLNMPVQEAVTWIAWVIPFVVDAYSTELNTITVSTTTSVKCSGRQERVWPYALTPIGNMADLTKTSSRTWRRSICAGRSSVPVEKYTTVASA